MPLESLHRLHQLNEHLKHIERDVEQTTKNRFTPYGDPRDRDYRRILVFYINCFHVRWKKFDLKKTDAKRAKASENLHDPRIRQRKQTNQVRLFEVFLCVCGGYR